MKTFSSVSDLAGIRNRIGTLRGTETCRWGRMNVHQMLCHLTDSYRFGLGERLMAPVKRPLVAPVMVKWIALRSPFRWPHGVPTAPEMNQEIGGTRPAEFAADRLELLAVVESFARRSGPWPAHPGFGPLTTEEWMRWGYLHADHHLRQFGS